MVRTLLIRGMLVGILAGLLAFAFAKAFGENPIDIAIAFEDAMAKAHGEQPEPEIVSREIQSTLGLFTAVVVYGTALGGLFSLVFAYAYGRIGSLTPRVTSALLAGGAFLTLVIVPMIKYPANPPSVGDSDTIGVRTALFTIMIVLSVLALMIAATVGRKMATRMNGWNAALIGGLVFIVLVAPVQLLLPTINEVPHDFPAVTLWQFRIASIGIQAILWTTIGFAFGASAEKILAKA